MEVLLRTTGKTVDNWSATSSDRSVFSLSLELANRIEAIGAAVHIGLLPRIGKLGEVLINDMDERPEKEMVNAELEGTRRPSTGSRQRPGGERGTPHRTWTGVARARLRPGPCHDAYATGVETLGAQYKCEVVEDEAGIWVMVQSHPLGDHGPKLHFLIAFPLEQRIMPRAWAFSQIGNRVHPFGFRHTNVPDQSICAFSRTDRAWDYSDGLIGFVDLLSLWAAKQIFFMHVGWWPGRQYVAGSLYRRNTQAPLEYCGCGSGLSYTLCHQHFDAQVSEAEAVIEYRKLFAAEFGSQSIPDPILVAARTRWKQLPTIKKAYAYRMLDPVRG